VTMSETIPNEPGTHFDATGEAARGGIVTGCWSLLAMAPIVWILWLELGGGPVLAVIAFLTTWFGGAAVVVFATKWRTGGYGIDAAQHFAHPGRVLITVSKATCLAIPGLSVIVIIGSRGPNPSMPAITLLAGLIYLANCVGGYFLVRGLHAKFDADARAFEARNGYETSRMDAFRLVLTNRPSEEFSRHSITCSIDARLRPEDSRPVAEPGEED
jgi:hypothetical protein